MGMRSVSAPTCSRATSGWVTMTFAQSARRSSLLRATTLQARCSGHWISTTSPAPTATKHIPLPPLQAGAGAHSVVDCDDLSHEFDLQGRGRGPQTVPCVFFFNGTASELNLHMVQLAGVFSTSEKLR